MKLEEPESGTQSRSHPAAKPSRRGPSIDPGSAMTHSKSPPLPVRSPAKASRGPKLGVPRYKPPTVEAAPRSSPVAHRPKSPAREHVLERIRSTQSPHISSQQIPRLAKPLSILESPKRKRPILEDEELPDSSPPEVGESESEHLLPCRVSVPQCAHVRTDSRWLLLHISDL